ncbi:hypothetical protein [Afipia carboxidovorans]|uniref:hypothetical protein n=1 Tax=Afipia carboxidovorans TaxID=40137 RepID=UPI003086AF83|nr:hypothetical protein CRBSH125_26440 [Afipia carboxidovorans]
MHFIFFRSDDVIAGQQAARFLPEGRTYPIDKKWSVRADKAHVPGMKDHNHIHLHGYEIAVVNNDGSPSHNSDLSKVPSRVLSWMKDKKLTESYLQNDMLTERVPAAVITEAVRHETGMTKAEALLSKMGQSDPD